MSGTNTISGGYMPSFYKKDLGSADHRGHQSPSVESTASSEDTFWEYSAIWLILTVQPPNNAFLKTCQRYRFWCYFRLCNMAVRPESDEHLSQHANDQQEHAGSAAPAAGPVHPRANGLVCQIWTPLVPCLELWPVLLRLSPPKSRPSCFII